MDKVGDMAAKMNAFLRDILFAEPGGPWAEKLWGGRELEETSGEFPLAKGNRGAMLD